MPLRPGQQPKNVLTHEDAVKGGKMRGKNFLKSLRLEKKMAQMGFTAEQLTNLLNVLKIWVATPVGQAFIGIIASELVLRKGFNNAILADGFEAVILSAEVIGAIGGSNIIAQVAGLIGAGVGG